RRTNPPRRKSAAGGSPTPARAQMWVFDLKLFRPGPQSRVEKKAGRGATSPAGPAPKKILAGRAGGVFREKKAPQGAPAKSDGEGGPERCAGRARLAPSTGLGAAPSPSSSRRIPD